MIALLDTSADLATCAAELGIEVGRGGCFAINGKPIESAGLAHVPAALRKRLAVQTARAAHGDTGAAAFALALGALAAGVGRDDGTHVLGRSGGE